MRITLEGEEGAKELDSSEQPKDQDQDVTSTIYTIQLPPSEILANLVYWDRGKDKPQNHMTGRIRTIHSISVYQAHEVLLADWKYISLRTPFHRNRIYITLLAVLILFNFAANKRPTPID